MAPSTRTVLQSIQQLEPESRHTNGRVAALDALCQEWRAQWSKLNEDERLRRRQRTLRKLAIETGILERLYDIEWGLTLSLVAEGLTRDVVERAGGRVDDTTIATLAAQRDSLEMVIEFVRDERRLTPSFIKELHHAITRTQATYTATDALGQVVERELPHGRWKQWPHHVQRRDGSVLEYCPPEHVDAEIDQLTQWYEQIELESVHPMIIAAWLHHRFVQIHPFADGNGRVARALTVLVMQRHQLAPLVIDRFHRAGYLDALDRANDGDLRPLIELFINLESTALVSELEAADTHLAGTSSQVAHTLAARRAQAEQQLRNALVPRATAILAQIRHWLTAKERELGELFAEQGIRDVRVQVNVSDSEHPEHPARARLNEIPKHAWFRRQVIQSAQRAGHFAYFGGFVALARLKLTVEGVQLDFLVSLHGAGERSGSWRSRPSRRSAPSPVTIACGRMSRSKPRVMPSGSFPANRSQR